MLCNWALTSPTLWRCGWGDLLLWLSGDAILNCGVCGYIMIYKYIIDIHVLYIIYNYVRFVSTGS